MPPAAPIAVVFALFPDLTQLDFTGPLQVLSRVPGAQVTVASREGGEITSDAGLTFAGLTRLSEVEHCDVLCVPGGFGVNAAMNDTVFLADLRRLAASARYVTSVCTGSLVLGAAGLLTGRRAACHWSLRDLLSAFGAIPDEGRVVRDGDVITGGGVTAGIDFALTLAAELSGEAVAQGLQLALEYAPAPPFDAGRIETAPAAVVEAVRRRYAAARPAAEAAVAAAVARLEAT